MSLSKFPPQVKNCVILARKKREDLTEGCMDAVFFFDLTAAVLRCCRRRGCHRHSVSSLSKFPPDSRFSLSLSLSLSHPASHL
jgi:hypothetical protein